MLVRYLGCLPLAIGLASAHHRGSRPRLGESGRNYTEYLRIPSLGSSCGPLIPWKRCLRRLSIWWREGRRACGRSKSTKPTSTQGQRVFITNVKGTFFGMSEFEEASKSC